jgi:uncharacterized protein
MPEYLAPGIFMEEVSYRSKSIEGVSTTTTGFVGPARFGPTAGVPPLVTSYTEFEATYGDDGDVGGDRNYLALGVRAFFEQGGKRLYVSRVIGENNATSSFKLSSPNDLPTLTARHPGAYGDFLVRIRLDADPDSVRGTKVSGLRAHDVVLVTPSGKAPDLREVDVASSGELEVKAGSAVADAPAFTPGAVPAGTKVQLVTASLTVTQGGKSIFSAARLALSGNSSGASLERCLAPDPTGLSPITSEAPWPQLIPALGKHVVGNTASDSTITLLAADTPGTGEGVVAEVQLDGGADGGPPDEAKYTGEDGAEPTGLFALEHIPEISIVAAPAAAADADNHAAVCAALVTHVERMRYRVAVLDAANGDDAAARELRGGMDSTRAALYYPWVTVPDPTGPGTLDVPPSGFVAGIYARNDVNRGVWKAPANEVVLGALKFSKPVNTGRQEVLNPLGINCLRTFEGRGHRVWGARTASSDPEWKYLNVRRYFNYLERSIDVSTQWAVFEPNAERLWGNVRRTIGDFLLDEFQKGALLGDKPEAAYFVKCDRSTMTQNDLDNGRLVVLVGVVAIRPAEFVIFRIGQWTSDRRS